MPLVTNYKSLDTFYNEVISTGKVTLLVNDLDYMSDTDKSYLEHQMINRVEDDIIEITPSCYCGFLNTRGDENITCPECGTKVVDHLKDFNPIIWFKIPDHLESWISPYFLAQFLSLTYGDKKSMIRWFTDKHYNPPVTVKKDYLNAIYKSIEELPNFSRSYSFFISNIHHIIDIVVSHTTDAKRSLDLLRLKAEYVSNIDTIHSQYLPMLNKRFITMEQSNKGQFIFKDTVSVINITFTFLSAITLGNDKKTEVAIGKILNDTAVLLGIVNKNILGGKGGIARKHMGGLRGAFTFRTVITPVIGKLKYDEVEIPWWVFVTAFKPFIFNLLYKRGYSYREISKRLLMAVHTFDQEIYDIGMDAIQKSEDGCLYVVQLRNPAQGHQGSQLMKCRYIKPEPDDKTTSIPVLAMVLGNGDADGDEYNFTICTDRQMVEYYKPLEPHNCFLGNAPAGLMGKIDIPKPVGVTMSRRVFEEKKLLTTI